jgi:integrase
MFPQTESNPVGLSATTTIPELCHGSGGELEQIQFLLGHASVQTTERYIGSKQKLQDAVNDRLGISVAGETA